MHQEENRRALFRNLIVGALIGMLVLSIAMACLRTWAGWMMHAEYKEYRNPHGDQSIVVFRQGFAASDIYCARPGKKRKCFFMFLVCTDNGGGSTQRMPDQVLWTSDGRYAMVKCIPHGLLLYGYDFLEERVLGITDKTCNATGEDAVVADEALKRAVKDAGGDLEASQISREWKPVNPIWWLRFRKYVYVHRGDIKGPLSF